MGKGSKVAIKNIEHLSKVEVWQTSHKPRTAKVPFHSWSPQTSSISKSCFSFAWTPSAKHGDPFPRRNTSTHQLKGPSSRFHLRLSTPKRSVSCLVTFPRPQPPNMRGFFRCFVEIWWKPIPQITIHHWRGQLDLWNLNPPARKVGWLKSSSTLDFIPY